MVTISKHLIGRACFSLVALVLATCAYGELPAVLDRIPPGPETIVAIGNLADFDKHTSDLITSLELDAISTFSQALGALGLRDGLDMQGSAAGVLYPPAKDDEAATPRVVLVIPLTSYDVFTKNMRAASDNGIERFDYAQMTFFARELAAGSFAAISQQRDLVEAFADQRGHLAAHQKAIGLRGMQVAQDADIIAIMPVEKARPLIATALDPLFQKSGRSFPGIGDEDNAPSSLVQSLTRRVERQGETATLALTASPLGLKLDLAVRFRDGTEMAQLSHGEAPRFTNLLARLPNSPALLVGSVNLAHPGVRTLITEGLDDLDLHDDKDLASQLALASIRALAEMNSASIAVYSPPALLGGLLTHTAIVWQGNDPASAASAFQHWLITTGQRDDVLTSYASGAQQIADASLDSWAIIPNTAAPLPDPLFGMGGIKGFINTAENHGAMLWSQDEAFAKSVLDPAEPMTQDLMLSQVGDLLPSDRIIDFYLNPGPILTLTAPMLSLLTGGKPLDIPRMLPPIGASISLSDGAMHASIFVPAPLLQFSLSMKDMIDLGSQQP